MKWLIIGEAASGKSTLVQSLLKRRLQDSYKPDDNQEYLEIQGSNETWKILIAGSYKNKPALGQKQLRMSDLIDRDYPPEIIYLLFDLNNPDSLDTLSSVIGAIRVHTIEIQPVGGHQIQLMLVGTKNDLLQKIRPEEIDDFQKKYKINHYQSINTKNHAEAINLFKLGELLVRTERVKAEERIQEKNHDLLKNPLQQYVQRIDSYQNYQKDFHFFKGSRALNREINHQTANALLHSLDLALKNKNGAMNIDKIFSKTNIQTIRNNQLETICKTHKNNIGALEKFIITYICVAIHSKQLNDAIKHVQDSLSTLQSTDQRGHQCK